MSERPSNDRQPTLLAALAAFCLTLSLSGCANPGPPQPPSLHLPKTAEQLHAERLGPEVRLSWTTPADSTNGEHLKDPITAIVCRESGHPAPKSAPARQRATCDAIQRFAVTPGASSAVDLLPPALASGPPTLLSYRIELFNARQRTAGPSDPVSALAGSAPPETGPLAAKAERNGILITWNPQPGAAEMELKRKLVPTPGHTVATPKPAKPARDEAIHKKSTTPHKPANEKANPDEVILRAEMTPDHGGTVDPGVQDGETYTYTAQRVQTVIIGTEHLELRGLASPAVTLAYHNVLPPLAPTGLVSVPGGGFGSAPSIDLSWQPNGETDVTGYNVYRSDRGSSGSDHNPFTLLTPQPVATPSYEDKTAQPGQLYVYRVTAVDERHHESKPTPEIQETLQK